jgi:nucleoside-diphosphate-sugar epimerase
MAGERRRVLITGGSGFVGACLARARIAAGDDVHLLLRRDSNLWRLADVGGRFATHRADLRDARGVRRAVAGCRPEVIYHLAMYGGWQWQKGRSETLATNVLGLAHLLDALEGHDYHALINAGTCSEYGPHDGRIGEGERLDPRTDYAVAKAAATLLCQAEAARGRPVTTVRLFVTYGATANPGTLFPYVMGCCLRGETPRVTAGDQRRDFIHVDDVAALLQAAADCRGVGGQVLHAGTGQAHSVREAVEMMLAVCGGGRVTADFGAEPLRPGEPPVWLADIRRTSALTGWKPRLDLHAGIERTWTWFRAAAGDRAA